MSKLDWKSGPIPRAGVYVMRDPHDADADAVMLYREQMAGKSLWIGPLPEKAPEPPAPDWGRGPVPADGLYRVDGDDGPVLRRIEKNQSPGTFTQPLAWYGPIPDRPAEDPAETNDWADLHARRCDDEPGCVFAADHHGQCHLANGDPA